MANQRNAARCGDEERSLLGDVLDTVDCIDCAVDRLTQEFERILGPLVYKPSGKPVLVRESDKRPEYNTATTDFNE